MIKRLLILAIIYCTLFVLGLSIPYFFSGYPLFKYGNPVLGISLISMHIIVLISLLWLLVGAYELSYPYLLLLIVIILDLIYHYYIEKKILIYYSPMYDLLYRMIHHIKGGF